MITSPVYRSSSVSHTRNKSLPYIFRAHDSSTQAGRRCTRYVCCMSSSYCLSPTSVGHVKAKSLDLMCLHLVYGTYSFRWHRIPRGRRLADTLQWPQIRSPSLTIELVSTLATSIFFDLKSFGSSGFTNPFCKRRSSPV
jgi:hypothetical protein